jgi:hypothetical protein
MIKLISETDDEHKAYTVVERIEMTVSSDASVDEMLDVYKQFLNACGYHIDGYFEQVKYDEEEENDFRPVVLDFTKKEQEVSWEVPADQTAHESHEEFMKRKLRESETNDN